MIYLFQAILEGCKIRKQAYGTWYSEANKTSCALGAAAEALGEKMGSGVGYFSFLSAAFPVMKQPTHCPVCTENNPNLADEIDELQSKLNTTADFELQKQIVKRLLQIGDKTCEGNYPMGISNVGNIVMHLNDRHMWSRERIAGWLRGIEEPMSNEEIIQKMLENSGSTIPMTQTQVQQQEIIEEVILLAAKNK